jgi:hypothetical protein
MKNCFRFRSAAQRPRLLAAVAGILLVAPALCAQGSRDASAPAKSLAPPPRNFWAPPDIDEVIPRVDPAAACNLPEVMDAAAARLRELLINLERFAATELIDYNQVNRDGKSLLHKTRSYDYIVSLREIRPGLLSTEESRNGRDGPQYFFMDLATNGLPALVFILHPYYANDFEMTCEGLGEANAEPAWQVHFRQRPDRPSRMYRLYVGQRRFDVPLRGRAWISARTSQVLRLEADIVQPVKGTSMKRSHKIIEYRPVKFARANLELWLPARAEVFLELGGHHFQIRHSFSEFLLFNVTTNQTIVPPPPPPVPPPPDLTALRRRDGGRRRAGGLKLEARW